MKVTTSTQSVTRISVEPGDTLVDLWKAAGQAPGGRWPVAIEDGVIVARQPSEETEIALREEEW